MRVLDALHGDDKRLNEARDFEVRKVYLTGTVLSTELKKETTLNQLFEEIQKKHRGGVTLLVLDYGDELHSIITPKAESVKHRYEVVIKVL